MSHDTSERGSVQILEVTAQVEDILQQNIDIERFKDVPEHEGNLQRLIERYGDNPGEKCPYIKSLGAAGIELVQKLAAAESNPERGPTMRELMEAKKKQAQVSETVAEKPKPTKDITETVAKVVESKPDVKPDVAATHANATESLIDLVHTKGTTEKALRPIEVATIKETTPVDIPVKPIEQRQQVIAHSQAEITREQQNLNIVGVTEPERAHHTDRLPVENIDTQTYVLIEPSLRNEVAAAAEQQSANTTENVPTPVANITELFENPSEQESTVQLRDYNELTNEIVIEPTAVDGMTEHEIASETDAVALVTEVDEFDLETSVAELGLNDFVVPEAANDIQADKLEGVTLPDLVIEVPADVPVLNETLAENIVQQETASPVELEEELSAYIQLLQPSKAETARATLDELVEAVKLIQENVRSDSVEVIVPTEKIEQLFAQLLESLGLDYGEETVRGIMQTLLSPEILEELAEEEQLSIDQLNYMGTREYKSNSVISMFTSLIQLIKDKVEPYLRIGRYALSASLA
jgi:hypothetical protein